MGDVAPRGISAKSIGDVEDRKRDGRDRHELEEALTGILRRRDALTGEHRLRTPADHGDLQPAPDGERHRHTPDRHPTLGLASAAKLRAIAQTLIVAGRDQRQHGGR